MKNPMKKMAAAVAFLAACAAGATAGELDDGVLRGSTDKGMLSYAPGEEMVFTLTLDRVAKLPPGAWFIRWTRSGDDGRRDGGQVPADLGNPLVVRTSLDRPGFVRVRAELVDGEGKVYRRKYTGDETTPEGRRAKNAFYRNDVRIFFDGGAGVQVDTLRPHPEPADFDAFWARQAARLARVPVTAERVEVKRPADAPVRVYAVRIACAGLRPVTGYLTVPKAAEKGVKFPCQLQMHGYDNRIERCGHGRDNAAPKTGPTDLIRLNINEHGMPLPEFGATAADRKALQWEITSNGKGYAFDEKQNEDPETAYFNGMALRVKRALQYLKTLPEWNGKDLFATGGSMGGFQTIWAAGCGEGVTRADCWIPWCCDIYTNGKLRKDPKLRLASDGWYVPWTESMGYYDAANFAKRIPLTCRTDVQRAGLGDYCCPPTGIAKMFNSIPGNKRILWVQGSTHGFVPPDPNPTVLVDETTAP